MPQYTITLDTNTEDEFEYEWAREELDDLFQSASAEYFFIGGHNMGWRHLEGFTVVKYNKVIDALTFNSDYRLEVQVDEEAADELKVWRFSHDEPCGAAFTIRPASEEEVETYA